VRGGGEAAYVDADRGDDDVRGGAADAGDLIQPLGRLLKRGDLLPDLGLQRGDVGAGPAWDGVERAGTPRDGRSCRRAVCARHPR
jgi:hypothetical protein